MAQNSATKPTNPLRDEPLFTTILDTANDIALARGYQITLTPGECGLVLDAVWLINRTKHAVEATNAQSES